MRREHLNLPGRVRHQKVRLVCQLVDPGLQAPDHHARILVLALERVLLQCAIDQFENHFSGPPACSHAWTHAVDYLMAGRVSRAMSEFMVVGRRATGREAGGGGAVRGAAHRGTFILISLSTL